MWDVKFLTQMDVVVCEFLNFIFFNSMVDHQGCIQLHGALGFDIAFRHYSLVVQYLKSVWLKNVKFTKTVQENFYKRTDWWEYTIQIDLVGM